jgi:hypothetical protein
MRIVINAPADDMESYLEVVADQFANGCTSGYHDAYTHWQIEES